MGASKKKRVVQVENPKNRYIGQTEDPNRYYKKHPSWNFNSCDLEMWPLNKCNAGDLIWSEIIPHLKSLETQTWNDILVIASKHNHSIDIKTLNPIAQKRLAQKYIEHDSIISLSLTGTHRIYGYIVDTVFNILWYDTNHGDNNSCVCKSRKKNT